MRNSKAKFGAQVYCLGEAISDTFLRVEESEIIDKGSKRLLCVPFGEKLDVELLYHRSGGSAVNVSVGLKRLGIDSHIIAALGEDGEGDRIIADLKSEGVDDSLIIRDKDFVSKSSVIISNPDGDRSIFVHHGKGLLTKDMISWDGIDDGTWLFIGPIPEAEDDLIEFITQIVKAKKLKLAIIPGKYHLQLGIKKNNPIISNSEIYVLNKEEAQMLFPGVEQEKELLQEFINAGAQKIVITNGREGSFGADGENFYQLSILKVKTLDMTGAGDSYVAGLLAGLINNKKLPEAMVWGAIDSAANVEHFGAKEGLLLKEQLIKRKAESKYLKAEEI